MKKILITILVVMVSCLNAQTNKNSNYWFGNGKYINKSDSLELILTTYGTYGTYTGSYWLYNHYKNYSPAELLFRSVQFQQGAMAMSILGGISGGLFFGLSPLTSRPIGMFIAGGIISGGFFIGALVMYGLSNTLSKEAYLKMKQITINANGFVIEF